MSSNWVWEFDEDDFDEPLDISPVKQNSGRLSTAKMKITNVQEDSIRAAPDDLSDQELLVEEMRAVGIEYREGIRQDLIDQKLKFKEENSSKVIFQGKLPVFIGSDHFYVTMANPKKKKKEKHRKGKRTKPNPKIEEENPLISNEHAIQESDSTYPTMKIDTNPFRNTTEPEKPPALLTPIVKEENEMVKQVKSRRVTVAQRLIESANRQKNNKKKTFKKFNEVNFNPPEPDGPTIGMADHKYWTARELYIDKFAIQY